MEGMVEWYQGRKVDLLKLLRVFMKCIRYSRRDYKAIE